MPAHEANPILPRRDRTLEAKSRNPAVPRAPRAKARSSSMGVLARELKKEGSQNTSISSNLSRTSEQRQPRNESPLCYARVNLLQREKTSVDNQVFEMGPKVRSSSLDYRNAGDYQRGHSLAAENAINQGMPWCQPTEHDDSVKPKARRSTLKNEHLDADQALEWVPEAVEAVRSRAKLDCDSELRSHARVNIYTREVRGAAQALEMAPMVQVCGFDAAAAQVGEKFHGRRNVLRRETNEESVEAPKASGYADGGVPTYGRKNLLPPRPTPQQAH